MQLSWGLTRIRLTGTGESAPPAHRGPGVWVVCLLGLHFRVWRAPPRAAKAGRQEAWPSYQKLYGDTRWMTTAPVSGWEGWALDTGQCSERVSSLLKTTLQEGASQGSVRPPQQGAGTFLARVLTGAAGCHSVLPKLCRASTLPGSLAQGVFGRHGPGQEQGSRRRHLP